MVKTVYNFQLHSPLLDCQRKKFSVNLIDFFNLGHVSDSELT